MNSELRNAKEACNKAYQEYMQANKAVCDALEGEEKKQAIEKLEIALKNFHDAQHKVATIQEANYNA